MRLTRVLTLTHWVRVARRLSLAEDNEWECGILVITHFKRLLQELTPTMIHVLSEGRVVATGGPELSEFSKRDGYEPFRVASAVPRLRATEG